GGRLAQILLGRELSQAARGGTTPVLHLRLVGNVTRLLVVGFRAWKAEVAGEVSEDVRDRPEGNQHGVGSGQSAGEGQQILVRGCGALAVIDSDGEQSANASQEQPQTVPAE